MRLIGRMMVILSGLWLLAPTNSLAQPLTISDPQPVPEQCTVEVVIASVGQPISLLFEPPLEAAVGEQLVYDTLMGSFLSTSPSLVSWVPTCAGWDFIQVRAVDAQGRSRVVARVDFIVDDESQLTEVYELTVEVDGRGWIVPLSEGGSRYTAIWLSEVTTQAPGRPGRGGRICLPRPKIPPGKTCASLHPDPNHPSNWICTPFFVAETYPGSPRNCGNIGGGGEVTICGSAAAKLKARLGISRGCVSLGGGVTVCVVAGGCVRIVISGSFIIRCETWRDFRVQRCIRMCCVNGRVVCCEQHRWTKVCTYTIWHFPPPIGDVIEDPVCSPPAGPFVEPCGS
ncbi:MAG: hypothetical protein KatS3mg019_1434 [Fimbriimonadales bacterium]|nr:MAG: hypothetical protein KatS3mg019_1434 [Fimbriimonadales bacterium]